jgi:hypothetical protein
MQIVTRLVNAAPRIVSTRDGRQFTLYELFAADGTTWVAKADVFNIAQTMVGQQVEIVGRVEQKGNFTNYYADLVQLAGAPQATHMQAMQAVQQAQQSAVAAGRVQQALPGSYPTEKDHSITRQTAGKVAAQISSTPQEFWQNVQDLARYFDTGQVPVMHAGNPGQPNIAAVGANDGREYTDDDMPF